MMVRKLIIISLLSMFPLTSNAKEYNNSLTNNDEKSDKFEKNHSAGVVFGMWSYA